MIREIVAEGEKLCSRLPLAFSLYAFPYRSIVKREVKLAAINSDDCILNIGCGGMPFTAVHLASMTGAEVVGIDYDRDVIPQARCCVSSLGMEEQITISFGDGAQVDIGKFTAVVVALQAEKKEEILGNFLSGAAETDRLVLRQPRSFFAGQYDQLPDNYSPRAVISQPMVTFNRSALFVPGGKSDE